MSSVLNRLIGVRLIRNERLEIEVWPGTQM